jgi:hypothetical protein
VKFRRQVSFRAGRRRCCRRQLSPRSRYGQGARPILLEMSTGRPTTCSTALCRGASPLSTTPFGAVHAPRQLTHSVAQRFECQRLVSFAAPGGKDGSGSGGAPQPPPKPRLHSRQPGPPSAPARPVQPPTCRSFRFVRRVLLGTPCHHFPNIRARPHFAGGPQQSQARRAPCSATGR